MNKTIFSAGCLLLVACSATQGEPSSEPQSIARTAEALSNHEQCDQHGANAAFSPTGTALSTRVYDRSWCRKAFLVNEVTGESNVAAEIGWADTAPTTKDECLRAQVWSYVWHSRVNGQPELGGDLIDARSWAGTWIDNGGNGDFCIVPLGRYPHGTFGLNQTYRFAVASRQFNADGSYATRKVAMCTSTGNTSFGGAGGTFGLEGCTN